MKKTNKDLIWCPICEKYKASHSFYRGVIIHERDDVPEGMLYFINESNLGKKKRVKS